LRPAFGWRSGGHAEVAVNYSELSKIRHPNASLLLIKAALLAAALVLPASMSLPAVRQEAADDC